jgi:hypothetical protein
MINSTFVYHGVSRVNPVISGKRNENFSAEALWGSTYAASSWSHHISISVETFIGPQ